MTQFKAVSLTENKARYNEAIAMRNDKITKEDIKRVKKQRIHNIIVWAFFVLLEVLIYTLNICYIDITSRYELLSLIIWGLLFVLPIVGGILTINEK